MSLAAVYTYYTIISFVGVLLNLTLILLICRRTPKCLNSYSVFLTQLAIVDIVIAVLNWLSIPRCHTVQPVSFKQYGLCHLFGPVFCYATSSAKNTMYAFSPMIILSSFSLRFLTMKHHEPPSRENLVALSLISYVPGIVYAIFLGFSYTVEGSGSYDEYTVVVFSGISYKISMLLLAIIVFGGAVVGSIKCCLIIRIINRKRASLCKRTILLRKRMILTLALQNSIPFIQFVVGMYFVYTVMSKGSLENCNLRFHIGSVLPCLNALITIFCIDPYRNALGLYLTGRFVSSRGTTSDARE